MKELEGLTEEELREIGKAVDEALKELDKKGKKRPVDYRAILSSCSSRFSGSVGRSRSAGARRAGRPTDTEKK